MKRFLNKNILIYVLSIITLSLFLTSLHLFHKYSDNKHLAERLILSHITEISDSTLLTDKLEGKVVHVSGNMHAIEPLTHDIFDKQHQRVHSISRNCLWLDYSEEQYTSHRRSSSWKERMHEILSAKQISIGTIVLDNSVTKRPVEQWNIVYREEINHNYRVTVREVPYLDISCIAIVGHGRLQAISASVPIIYQTKLGISTKSLLKSFMDLPKDQAIKCSFVTFLLLIVTVFLKLRNIRNTPKDIVTDISPSISLNINKLNRYRRIYLAIILFSVIILDILINCLYVPKSYVGIIIEVLISSAICLFAFFFLRFIFCQIYRRQYKAMIILEIVERKDINLNYLKNSNFNKLTLQELGFLGDLKNRRKLLGKKKEYTVDTEDCFIANELGRSYQFFECEVTESEKSILSNDSTYTTLFHGYCLCMPTQIDSSIELMIDDSRMAISTSLPYLQSQRFLIAEYLASAKWRGEPQPKCDELLNNTQFVNKTNQIYGLIKKNFKDSSCLFFIKDAVLYIFIETEEDNFDPNLEDCLSNYSVNREYHIIETMCNLAAICKGLTISQSDTIIEISDDLIEF